MKFLLDTHSLLWTIFKLNKLSTEAQEIIADLQNIICVSLISFNVVKRKISNGTRTEAGTQAWEIFLALVDTCRKLGVNFYQYILDRISQTFEMPALATLIVQKSQFCPH